MKKEKDQKQSKGFFSGLFDWNIKEKELKNQIKNYDTLKFFDSARKIATACMIFSGVVTLLFGDAP